VCPQFDAFDALTVREHLTIYARLKGISTVRADVDLILAKVGLPEYAEQLAAKLSGGNKRKLSLAIALLGESPQSYLSLVSSGLHVHVASLDADGLCYRLEGDAMLTIPNLHHR
jgi:ATP-binding cassette, subfamily A (ABC1), member 3